LVHAVLLELVNAILPGGLELLVLAAGIPLSLLLAAVFHRYVEKPSSNLAKRVQLKRRDPASEAPNA
jgi:peptidoglycan/LPS O-acetylase OafA/YrhL